MDKNNKKRNAVECAMHYRQIIILVVCCLVAFLSLAVEVGGYGQFARSIEDFGKRHLAVVPLEVNPMTGALLADACDREAHRFAVDLKAAV